jgi:hypothetical protein
MKCKVDECGKDATYKKQQVCQKHYFRFMRSGTYELTRSRKYRIQNPAGYQFLYEPEHPMTYRGGYVSEHRFVYYNEISEIVSKCALCLDPVTWDVCHIDHIDEDVTNNDKSNLRCLCRACNVFRGHSECSLGKTFIEINGRELTASGWARQEGVFVTPQTITRRIRQGWSAYDAVYKKRITHHSTVTKVYKAKYDEVRGIKEIENELS